MKSLHPLQAEFDTKCLELNLKDNNKILQEAGQEQISWEEIYGSKYEEQLTSKDAYEHYIEIVVDENKCRVDISDENFSRASEYKTKLGKGRKLKSGDDMFWDLPSKSFVFNGKRYTVPKNAKLENMPEVHVIWSSRQPKWLVAESNDPKWIAHFEKLLDKHGGRRKEDQFLLPSTLMIIPKAN